MARILLENVSLKYPLIETGSKTLIGSISNMAFMGGRIENSERSTVTVQALDDISLALEEGDRLAIFGHNGAGKSSLLRVLSEFYKPSSGNVVVEGKVAAILSLLSGMKMNLTGYENILLGLALHDVERKQVADKAQEIAEFSDLGPFLDIPISRLSSGMLMRLAFAISTSVQADILLLDEWVGAGDVAFIDKAQSRLNQMLSGSTIVVYATHSGQVAKKLCNKAICLMQGKLAKAGSIDEVVEFYQREMERKNK